MKSFQTIKIMKIFKIKSLVKHWNKVFGSEEIIKGPFKLTEGTYGPKLNTISLAPEVMLNYDMNQTYHKAIICTFVSTDEGCEQYVKFVTKLEK